MVPAMILYKIIAGERGRKQSEGEPWATILSVISGSAAVGVAAGGRNKRACARRTKTGPHSKILTTSRKLCCEKSPGLSPGPDAYLYISS